MDPRKIAVKLIEYVVLGGAIAIAAHYLPKRNMKMEEALLIGATAAAVFLVLDMFVPSMGSYARNGAGLGIGLKQVGLGNPLVALGVEGFNGEGGGCGCEGFDGGCKGCDGDSCPGCAGNGEACNCVDGKCQCEDMNVVTY